MTYKINWNLDSGIGIEPTWNRNRRHNFMLESELESNYSQWNRNRNWNRMCRNRPITAINKKNTGLTDAVFKLFLNGGTSIWSMLSHYSMNVSVLYDI